MVDSANIQSQAKVFDLETTAFLTNWESGLSNFRPCLEWPATAFSGRGCRPECQRVHTGEENDKGHLKHVLRCKTSVSVKRYTGAFVAAYLPAGCRAAAAGIPVPKGASGSSALPARGTNAPKAKQPKVHGLSPTIFRRSQSL